MKPSTPSQATTAMHTTDLIDTTVSCAPSAGSVSPAISAEPGARRGLARWWRPVRLGALAALAVFVSCNLNESGESSTPDALVGFAPRILPAGEALPEVDSVRLVLRLGKGSSARTIEKTVPWGAREFVFDRVPVGSVYAILVEGRKVGMDRVTQSVWWRAEQSGTIAASNNAFSPILVVEELADMTVPRPVDPPAGNPPAVADTATKATLRFTAPADAESVYVAGQRLSFTPGQVVGADVLFAAGETEKTVLVRIVDSNDNVWQQEIVYRRASSPGGKDEKQPEITLLSPSKDTSLDAGTTSLLVRVRATDSSGIRSVTIEGQAAWTVDSTEWGLDLSVQSGTDSVEVVATDKSGLTARKTFAVTVPQSPKDVQLIGLGVTSEYVVAPRAPDTVWQVTVPNRVAELVLRPRTGDSRAQLFFEGKRVDSTIRLPLPARGGLYPLVLVVRSAQGDSTQGYLLRVEHLPLTRIELEPVGGREQGVPWEDSLVQVTWTVKGVRDLGEVLIAGRKVSCHRDTCSDSVKLAQGANHIGIEAAYLGIPGKWSDTIVVTRWSRSQSNDARLVNFGPGIEASQDGSDSEWVAEVSPETRSLLIAPQAANSAARIQIDGASVSQKTIAFGPERVQQYVVVKVTSEDSTRSINYRLSVLHPAMPPISIEREGERRRTVTFGVTSASAAWRIPTTGWPLGSVTIDGAAAQPAPDGRYVKNIAMARPDTFHAILRVGYQGGSGIWADTVTIVRQGDDSAPVITRGPGASMRSVSFDTTATSASWSVTDNHKLAAMMINGEPVQPANGVYRISLNLTQTRTPVVLEARDSSGNIARDSIEIVRSNDASMPVAVPGCGTNCDQTVAFGTQTYLASWTVTDNNAVSSVKIQDSLITGQSGIYSRTVPLAVGLNRIVLVASDPSNNETRDTIEIRRLPDRVAPSLSRAPDLIDGSQVAFSVRTINVGWTVRDNDFVDSVIIRGVQVTPAGTLYERTVALDTGVNVIRITAWDTSGNVARDSISVLRQPDRTAPVINILTTERTVAGSQTSIEIRCSASDAADGVSLLSINGVGVNPIGSIYSRSVLLDTGANTVRIVAYDPSNNRSEQTFNILRDNKAPRITATSRPASGFVPWVKDGTGTFTASWTLSDDHKIAVVKINDVATSTLAGGVFSRVISNVAGRNVVTMEAVDSMGNTTRDSIIIEAGLADADGNWYKIRQMPDGKVWMAQNLRTLPKNGGPAYACGGGDSANGCARYGLQYDWAEAMNLPPAWNSDLATSIAAQHQGLCPDANWHIPDSTEWSTLLRSAAGAQGKPSTDSAGAYVLRSADTWSFGNYESSIGGNLYDDFLVPSYNEGTPGGFFAGATYWLPVQRSRASAYYARFTTTAELGMFGTKFSTLKTLRCVAN